MFLSKILAFVAVIVLLPGAWLQFGWQGIALVTALVVMWTLLHFTRMVHILKSTSDRPIGHVASAVMLNAKLKKGVNLMHVIAMTRSLGQLTSNKNAQPEIFVWSDSGQSAVTCTFIRGKLDHWTLYRPHETDSEGDTSTSRSDETF